MKIVTYLNSKWSNIIASGTDMNTLVRPGFYYSPSSSVTASLANCPVTGSGFSLLIPPGGPLMHIIFVAGAGGKMYHRAQNSQGWQKWYVFTGTAID